MITLYSGTPGSGKSYHAVSDIYDNLLACKRVIGNFEINRRIAALTPWGYLKYSLHKSFGVNFKKYDSFKNIGTYYCIDNSYLTPDFLLKFARKFHKAKKEHQTLVVIDECGIIFNSRSFDKNERMKWIKFLSMHRHYGFDFILISQSDRMIDRQIRCLLEYDCKHRDGKYFKLTGRILSLILGGHLFGCVTMWYSIREKVNFKFLPPSNHVFDLYDTFALFDEEDKS